MTFSKQIKTEIASVKNQCKGCKLAMAYGAILGSKTSTENQIIIATESLSVAELITNLLVDISCSIVTLKRPNLKERTSRPLYTVSIDDTTDFLNIAHLISNSDFISRDMINSSLFKKSCCLFAFLRGIYLTSATVVDPLKEYHLEFSFKNENLCYFISDLLYDLELEFKVIKHNNNYVLYTKESNQIEDTLTILGAVKSSMDLMNLKIEKGLRNTVNRRTNCETANISKTVNASIHQLECIELLRENVGLDNLPIELKEVANLRLENPEASLTELCELLNNKISRSGINHRLKKLCSMAEGLVVSK